LIDAIATARLTHEIAIWRRAWKSPLLWWRDDDCREPTWELKRLLHVRDGLPLTLAVIPDGNLSELADKLEGAERVTIAQHGVDHENRLPDSGPRSEFLEDLSQEAINAQVAAGRARLAAAGLNPRFFVPPWNEVNDRLVAAIVAAGYDTYSIGIHGAPRDGLKHIGAPIDILRWKGKPHFKGRRRIADALRRELEDRRKSGRWAEPVGILTHHLVHDEKAWAFLDWFAKFSRSRFDWRSYDDLSEPAAEPVHDKVIPIRRFGAKV
jgi:peptidoglycan/xylan/chitin deacetylase (PgdA/CDA1 family)